MATTTQWNLILADGLSAPMKSIADAADNAAEKVESVGKKAESSKSKLGKMSAVDLSAIADVLEKLSSKFDALSAPGAKFSAQLKEFGAISGVTGKALDDIGNSARKTALEYGGNASEMLESYKALVVQLGDGAATNPKALELMGQNVATLSKAMGNDMSGAMNALTTSMKQMGVDMSNPTEAAQEMTRMMNVMAAGAKNGAALVPHVSAAFKEAGVEIRNANVSFEEANAALQALAKSGKYGAEAGTSLQLVLNQMSDATVLPKDVQDKLKELGVNYDIVSDKTLPLTARLRELRKAQQDAGLYAQIFGEKNSKAASILVNSVDAQDKMTSKITGTNAAVEQASNAMDSWGEKADRVKAWFGEFVLGVSDAASKIKPFIDGLSGVVNTVSKLSEIGDSVAMLFESLMKIPAIGNLVTVASATISTGFKMIASGARMIGVAIMNIPIIGWIAALIAGIIALGVYFYKTSATFRGVLMGVWSFIKTFFTGVAEFVGTIFKGIWHIIKGVFNPKNWFDKNYKFSDGFDMITGAAKKFGSNLSKAYGEGKAKGEESYYKDNPEKRPKPLSGKGAKGEQKQSTLAEKPTIALNVPDLNRGKMSGNGEFNVGTGINGSGGSSARNITQRIDIKNYFTISDSSSRADFESVAEKVVKAINDKLRDGLIASIS